MSKRRVPQNEVPAVIRQALPADIPVIRDLAFRIWREHYPGIISREQIDYMLERMYSFSVIRDEMTDRHRYVLVLKNSLPVGFAAFALEQGGRAVKIAKLYLLPELHGRGIGRKMLEHIKEEALRRGARMLTLFVNRNNAKAIAAYERFGMVKAAEIGTDIGGGFVMDDYRMELDLRRTEDR